MNGMYPGYQYGMPGMGQPGMPGIPGMMQGVPGMQGIQGMPGMMPGVMQPGMPGMMGMQPGMMPMMDPTQQVSMPCSLLLQVLTISSTTRILGTTSSTGIHSSTSSMGIGTSRRVTRADGVMCSLLVCSVCQTSDVELVEIPTRPIRVARFVDAQARPPLWAI